MHFQDNIDRPSFIRRPVVFAPLLAVLFLWLAYVGADHWPLLKAVGPAWAEVTIGHYSRNLVVIGGAALALGANIWGLSKLGHRAQSMAIWAECFVVVILFFVSFDLSFTFIARKLWILLSVGLVNTIYISIVSILLASVLAMVGAIAKLSSSGIATGIANFYTSLFRGVPLLMQIYLIYLGLPQIGVIVDAVPAGIAALSLCYGAYMTEIFRGGIESVPRGQWEAARALGFGNWSTLTRIIVPQALRVIIPPTGNQFIAMLKDSSLVSVVGVWELMYLARTQGQSEFRHIEMMLTASLIYWLFSIFLEMIQSRIERHFGRERVR